jgi:uncharacterized protein (DUF362 family)
MDHMNPSRKFCAAPGPMTRREFTLQAGLGIAGLALVRSGCLAQEEPRAELALAQNQDRSAALKTALGLLGSINFGGKDLYLKANFNSADPFPAATHPDMLGAVVDLLRECNCGKLTLVERSGMGSTRDIWERLGFTLLARRLDLKLVALDELPAEQWRKEELPGSNWKAGVEVPKFLDHDTFLVQICNLKTHRYGGVFSASLKNSVGLVAKYGLVNAGYNYMNELHASPQQGAMIAELNVAYEPKLIIMDAMQVFTAGGPETGKLANPGVVMASADRVAIDAAGVALLRLHAEEPDQPLAGRAVYEQAQIKRAAELNLGATNADAIHFLTADLAGSRLASQLEAIIQEPTKAVKQ